MGTDQWISISNQNTSPAATGVVIIVQNVNLVSGKFYVCDKDNEIPASDIEGHEISPGEKFVVSSSGLSDSPDGTEGSYDLVEKSTGDLIRTVHWNCPGHDQPNTFEVTGNTPGWIVGNDGTNAPGPIGDVFVTLTKIA